MNEIFLTRKQHDAMTHGLHGSAGWNAEEREAYLKTPATCRKWSLAGCAVKTKNPLLIALLTRVKETVASK